MEGTAAVILAAGKSTRMRSKLPKGLHRLWGKTVLDHIIDACFDAGIEEVVVVVGHQADLVRETLGDRVRYALQEEQKGTGHALMCARESLPEGCRCLFVMPGDAPLVTGEHLRPILEEHTSQGRTATVVTAELPDAGEYGRIVRDGSHVRIHEAKNRNAPPDVLAIKEFNTAVYAFDPNLVWDALDRVGNDNPQGEYFLTDVIGLLSKETERVAAHLSPDTPVWLGINNREELSEAGQLLRTRILKRHMHNGVSLVDPATTYIDATVRIGQDTTIYPGSVLEGNTVIGEDCNIGPYAMLTDARIGDGVDLRASQVTGSEIGNGSRCGPWSHLRPGSKVGEKVKLGNFVEINRSTVEDNVSIGHVSYIGDVEIGEATNIGAGTIFCNYDGKRKHKSRVGKRAFIGSNSTLVAPVTVEEGAYTGAGSVITEDVPADALALGRARQVIKEGWAEKRRARE
ncbi:MAG: bifunctional UDP-N-acetylglucosamine diphosphorylase/glucosamine-1-phosphate N-acetyltransferase GlmU [Armatimonadetes bacterium]|nr:bifunctional UDP-N-acetylglucosamine diphosphorylase/glucosamine-1-phosphate N-acetyltransferase GlmU [Armatimonadota bacterium]